MDNNVTIAPFYKTPPHYFQCFLFCLHHLNLRLSSSCLVFFFSSCFHVVMVMVMAACSHTDMWAVVTWKLVYLPTPTCSRSTSRHGWRMSTLLFWDTSGGKMTPPRGYVILQHLLNILRAFQKWPTTPRGPRCGVHEGFVGRARRTHSSGRLSVVSWLNVDVCWWLQAVCFCQSTKRISLLSAGEMN